MAVPIHGAARCICVACVRTFRGFLMSESLNDRLMEFFHARPNVWVDGRELSRIAGAYGWRSRVSDLRRRRGMTLENRQRTITRDDGSAYKVSEYRFVPALPTHVEPSGQV